MSSQDERYARLLAVDGERIELVVERDSIQPGRSFSAAALDELNHELVTWVGTRLMRRWAATDEPPTALRVELRVVVQ